MHNNESQSSGDRRRRSHSDEFKADAIAAAGHSNVSMASLAMSPWINADLLRRTDNLVGKLGRFHKREAELLRQRIRRAREIIQTTGVTLTTKSATH